MQRAGLAEWLYSCGPSVYFLTPYEGSWVRLCFQPWERRAAMLPPTSSGDRKGGRFSDSVELMA